MISPIRIQGQIIITSFHFIPFKEPTNQNITVELESSLSKIIPCVRLLKNKCTAIPAKANFTGVIFFVEPDNKYTVNPPINAPINAK